MSRNKRPRKAYRPRHVAVNTLELAIHNAAKPSLADRREVLSILGKAIQALCAGVATEQDWSVAAGSVAVAKAIERQGIVRGLAGHLDSAEQVLQAIYDRCRLRNMWLRTELSMQEADHLHLLEELHTYQVTHLGRAEFLAAMRMAENAIVADGHTVTLARDLERMAA